MHHPPDKLPRQTAAPSPGTAGFQPAAGAAAPKTTTRRRLIRTTTPALLLLLPLSLLLFVATGNAASLFLKTKAPIKNFQLPFFDKTNRLAAHIKAEQAMIPDDTQIHIVNMTLTQYEYPKLAEPGFAPDQTTTLSAPVATVLIRDQHVQGNSTVHLNRPDLDLTGQDWTYDHRQQKITINRDTRVTFLAPLPKALTQPVTPAVKKKKPTVPKTLPPEPQASSLQGGAACPQDARPPDNAPL